MGGALLAEPEEKENRQGGPCGLLCLLCCPLLFSLLSSGRVAHLRRAGDAASPHRFTFHRMPPGYFHGAAGRYFRRVGRGIYSPPNGIEKQV